MSESNVYELLEKIQKLTIAPRQITVKANYIFNEQSRFYYRHKTEPEKIVTDLRDFIKYGLHGADYEEVQEKYFIKDEILQLMFNDSKAVITDSNIDTFKSIVTTFEQIKAKQKKIKPPFETERDEARAKWQAEKNEKEKEKLLKIMEAVYVKYGKAYTPRTKKDNETIRPIAEMTVEPITNFGEVKPEIE